ncbi:hypothetical protein SYNPS1DRAFT_31201 [Syncephalis pseudoplumigaleata]|uniref:Uncharacterized protein n=1 Tax=Syncephalis pseudoplumigaleata TaxID=1712513 RepID=A0A4P9YV56_9FUNG|nr:hypothetical protein SYNPS1DRAFT_31201 [Syncephalis pseudoplumigaleata]|eukprot:RKP23101.1 hypothetical protein SYNPS1DRAFT_31201 [Syncephalis pseudoplumigaleata]
MSASSTAQPRKRRANRGAINPKSKQPKADMVAPHRITYSKVKMLLELARQTTRYALQLFEYYPDEDGRVHMEETQLSEAAAIVHAEDAYADLKYYSQRYFSKEVLVLDRADLDFLPLDEEERSNLCWQINVGFMSPLVWTRIEQLSAKEKTSHAKLLEKIAGGLTQLYLSRYHDCLPQLWETLIGVKTQAAIIGWEKRKSEKSIRELFMQQGEQPVQLDSSPEWMQERISTLQEKQEAHYVRLSNMSLKEIKRAYPSEHFRAAVKAFLSAMAIHLRDTLKEHGHYCLQCKIHEENTLAIAPQVIGAITHSFADDIDRTLDRIQLPVARGGSNTSDIIHASFMQVMEAHKRTSTDDAADDILPARLTDAAKQAKPPKKRSMFDRNETAVRIEWSQFDEFGDDAPAATATTADDDDDDDASHRDSSPLHDIANPLDMLRDNYHETSSIIENVPLDEEGEEEEEDVRSEASLTGVYAKMIKAKRDAHSAMSSPDQSNEVSRDMSVLPSSIIAYVHHHHHHHPECATH